MVAVIKVKPSGLSRHWPYNCTIDLLPGMMPLHGQIYPLSCHWPSSPNPNPSMTSLSFLFIESRMPQLHRFCRSAWCNGSSLTLGCVAALKRAVKTNGQVDEQISEWVVHHGRLTLILMGLVRYEKQLSAWARSIHSLQRWSGAGTSRDLGWGSGIPLPFPCPQESDKDMWKQPCKLFIRRDGLTVTQVRALTVNSSMKWVTLHASGMPA